MQPEYVSCKAGLNFVKKMYPFLRPIESVRVSTCQNNSVRVIGVHTCSCPAASLPLLFLKGRIMLIHHTHLVSAGHPMETRLPNF